MMAIGGTIKAVKEAVVRTLMSGPAQVHYGQIYVESGSEFPDMTECFGGQCNGLCGAAIPGFLFLITGLHTGYVGFTAELHDEPPPVNEGWQEIVETSFHPMGEATLVGWAPSGTGRSTSPKPATGSGTAPQEWKTAQNWIPGWRESRRPIATYCCSGRPRRSRTQ